MAHNIYIYSCKFHSERAEKFIYAWNVLTIMDLGLIFSKCFLDIFTKEFQMYLLKIKNNKILNYQQERYMELFLTLWPSGMVTLIKTDGSVLCGFVILWFSLIASYLKAIYTLV